MDKEEKGVSFLLQGQEARVGGKAKFRQGSSKALGGGEVKSQCVGK